MRFLSSLNQIGRRETRSLWGTRLRIARLLPSWKRGFASLGTLTLTFLSASGFQPPTFQDPVSVQAITIRLENQQGTHPIFKVVGWDQIEQISTQAARFKMDQWQALFAVYVDSGSIEDDLPPILGSYRIEGEALIFQSRFPLQPGLSYRAVFASASEPVTFRFDIPELEARVSTTVEQVYPSTDRLPENQLKFYLHFSAPMSRGEAYRQIHLLDERGDPVDLPFLELDEELWDREGKRLTLLFDPGRIKRDLVPHEEVGTPIKEGKAYTLLIDRDWRDARGKSLKESFRKSFKVVAADREIPDPKSWLITAPQAGSVQPLSVDFPEPMDHGLLSRVLEIMDSQGNIVEGSIQVDRKETRWQLTPHEPWKEGDYSISVETILEDLAGNRIDRLFEVEVLERVEERFTTTAISLPFKIFRSGS